MNTLQTLTIITVFSSIAFFLSYIIYHERHTGKHGSNIFNYGSCYQVLHSRFAQFLGFDIARMGMWYFGILTLVSLATVTVLPNLLSSVPVMALYSAGGLLAAVLVTYLLGLQMITLKKSCIWCIIIWLISIFLAIIMPQALSATPRVIFATVKPVLVILHALSAAVGVGAVIVTDVMFHRFLRDRVISTDEARTMDILSEVVWTALIMLIITGAYLVVADPIVFTKSKFLIKLLIVGVITVNGILLHMLVRPRLVHISFNPHNTQFHDMDHYRHIAFAFGAVSFVSWIIVFILGSLRSIPISFSAAFIIYLIIVAGAVLGSQIFEHNMTRK
jgi:uncharacterized membrane protein